MKERGITMTLEEEILNYLNNPSELKNIDEITKDNTQINEALCSTYGHIAPSLKLQFIRESGAYALAKAMEREILSEIRPGQVRVWLVLLEIQEVAKFNLPPQIEEKLYDYMDACENAIEEYTNNNLTFNEFEIYNRIQNIGTYLAKEHKLSEITTGGLSNDKIMTRDELHNFCMQGAVKALEQRGYKIENVYYGSANPVSLVASKEGITYSVAVVTAILPKAGELEGWRLHEFERVPVDETHKSAILGVSIIPTDELYASMGVAIKEGDYQFKVSPLEIVEPKKN